MVGGPPCSWCIFLSRSVHQRKAGLEEGDLNNAGVRLENLIVANLLVFIETLLNHGRETWFVIEQPMTSFMMKMKHSLQLLQTLQLNKSTRAWEHSSTSV